MINLAIENIIATVMCHLFGGYILQTELINSTKAENMYNLLVHCALYTLPFMVWFGITWKIAIVFFTHIIIDICRDRYKVISYLSSQIFHYVIVLGLYVVL